MTTETDRELLELAARAAGIGPILCYESARNCLRIGDRKKYNLWRPKTDDGDALRLAVKLNLMVDCDDHAGMAQVAVPPHWIRERINDDKYAATRRAIVRAAAAIGKQLKGIA